MYRQSEIGLLTRNPYFSYFYVLIALLFLKFMSLHGDDHLRTKSGCCRRPSSSLATINQGPFLGAYFCPPCRRLPCFSLIFFPPFLFLLLFLHFEISIFTNKTRRSNRKKTFPLFVSPFYKMVATTCLRNLFLICIVSFVISTIKSQSSFYSSHFNMREHKEKHEYFEQ